MNILRQTSSFRVKALAATVLLLGAAILAQAAQAHGGRVRGSVSVQIGPGAIAAPYWRGTIHPRVYIAPPLIYAPFAFPYGGHPYPYAYPYAYPYGYPYAYPYPPAPPQPQSYVERPPEPGSDAQPPEGAAPEPGYWYWCTDPQGYYPSVRECPQGWLQVPAQTGVAR
ncbi:MAG: hypothetical protein KJZ83_11775 [Burkholderiaceae bacterium]|nr:hypothetical protein [Burkholderiaceae bacterium]